MRSTTMDGKTFVLGSDVKYRGPRSIKLRPATIVDIQQPKQGVVHLKVGNGYVKNVPYGTDKFSWH